MASRLLFCLLSILLLVNTSCDKPDAQLLRDPVENFDALWHILDRQYCFFEYKQIDWDKVYSTHRPRVSSEISSDSLFVVMADMLAELRDGHVNLIAPHNMSRYWNWQTDYPSNFSTAIQARYLGNDYNIASGLRYTILPDNIGYVYYPSFATAIGNSNLDEVIRRFSSCHGMIFDVRGNGGGTLTTVDQLASRFFSEKRLVGYISHKQGPAHNDFSPLYPKYIEPSDRRKYQQPVVLLVNRGCYSACNEFVSVMRYADKVTIVGDQSGGGSGLPFSSELPNGWSVRFSTSPMFDADKQHIEFGVKPDIEVFQTDSDTDAGRDTLIEFARQLLKGETE